MEGGKMAVSEKSKKELIEENKALRSRLQELEQSENECKRAKEESKRSKEFMNNVINTLDDPFFVKDQEHRWFMLNDAACKVMGRPREELIGKSDYDLFPEEQADVFWEKDNLVLETGKTNINEEKITWHGKVHTISTKKSLYTDPVTSKKFITGTIRDVTERKGADETIRESEEKFRSLAEQSPNMIFINKEGRIVYANKKCEEITGYKREEFYCPDFNFLNLIAPQSLELIKKYFKEHMGGREVPPYEYTIINKAGERIEAINSSRLIQYEGGNAILGVVTDITERKKVEESLRQSEELSRACLNATNDMVYLVDTFRNILTVNDNAAQSLGKTPAEVIGKNIFGYFSPDVAKSRREYGDKVIHSGKKVRFQDEREGKFFDISIYPTFDSQEKVDRLAVFVTDITEQKKAEAALRQSEERYRSLIANIPDVVWTSDEEGNTIFISENVRSIYGYSPGEIYAQGSSLWFGRIHPDDVEKVKDSYRAVFEANEQLDIEYRVRKKDGRWLWIRDRSTGSYEKEGIKYADGVFSDISERKKAQETVQHERDMAQKYLDVAGVMLMIIDKDRKVKLINQKGCQILGYEEDEIIGKDWFDIFLPEYVHEKVKVVEEKLRTGDTQGVEYFENPVLTKSGQERIIAWHNTLLRDEEGVPTGVLCSGEDITERKRADEVMKKSSVIIDSTTDAVITTDVTGNITFWNKGAEIIYGYQKEEAIGKHISIIYKDEDQNVLDFMISELMDGKDIKGIEVTCIDKKRQDVEIFLSLTSLRDEQGNIIEFVGITKDNTERKRAERELNESRQRLENLIENTPIVCFTYSRDGQIQSWNSAAEKVYGYTKEEAVGSSAFDLIVTPMTKDATDKVIQEVFDGKTIVGAQWQDRDKKGAIGWRMGNTFPLFSADGSVYCGVNMNIDITESKQAEDALRQSEEKFRSAFKHAAIGRAMAGLDGHFLDVNSMCCEILGYSEQELLQMTWMDVNHPADLKTNLEYVRQLKEGKIPSSQLVVRAIRKDGHIIWLDINVVMVRDSQGRPLYMLGDIMDITEHKRAKEQMLIKDDAVKSSINAIALARLDGNLTYVNKSFLDMWGYQSEQEVLGRRVQEFWRNSNDALNVVEKLHNEGKDVGELTAIRKDGSLFDVQLSANMVLDNTGKALCMMASFVDVTERNRLEEAYRSLVDNSLQGLAILQDGRMVFLNKAFSSTTGYSEQELLAASAEQIQSLVHPEDRALVWQRHRDRLAGKPVPARYEFRFVRKDGSAAWVEIFASEFEYQGRPAIQAAYIDITERKKAEEALRQSEERLKILFESAPDAIYLSDLEGNFVDANKAAEQITGYKKNELLEKSFIEMGLLSSEQVLKVVANLKKIAKGKPTGPDEFTLTRKDGSSVSVEIRAFLVRIGDRILSLSIAHDISARKKTEKKLLEHRAQLKSLASELSLTEERERHRLATSLHDQISQALVISRIKLQALHASVSSAEISGPLEEACENLDRIIQDTRTLTFDLSSPILYELGFEAAVSEWLEEQITKKHGIKTEFKDDGRPKPLDDDIRILLFRNVRELLINIVKHARAKSVKVSIRRIRQQIYVCVEDDGIGFDHSELSSSSGFGIFSIRERLEQLAGHIDIESEPGRGSKITMTAPLKCDKVSRSKKRKSR
jgi:PAS domain S-box-containing protein